MDNIQKIKSLQRKINEELIALDNKTYSRAIKEKVRLLTNNPRYHDDIFNDIQCLLRRKNLISNQRLSDIINAYDKYIDLVKNKDDTLSTYMDLCNLLSQIPFKLYNYIENFD